MSEDFNRCLIMTDLPGRLRLRAVERFYRETFVKKMEGLFGNFGEITLESNRKTGSVTFLYDQNTICSDHILAIVSGAGVRLPRS
jgi:hypothetical protein